MARDGGGVVDPAGARLVFQVANEAERGVLHEKLVVSVYGETPFRLLRLFTAHPIHTRAAFDSLAPRLCLPAATVELDISESYYALGHDAAAAAGGGDAAAVGDAERRRYAAFRAFIATGLPRAAPASEAPKRRASWAMRASGHAHVPASASQV